MNFAIIRSSNGLSPVRHHAITWTNDDLLLSKLFVTKFIETEIKIQNISRNCFSKDLQNVGHFVQASLY